MNYREFYEAKTGFRVSKNWHVHHINCDQGDNSILNLVAIPNRLHTSYHSARAIYERESANMLIPGMAGSKSQCDRVIKSIEKLKVVSGEVYKYICQRNHQLSFR